MAQPSVVKNKVKYKVPRSTKLTAGNLHGTFLCIQGVHLEVHGTGESQRHADAEQDRPVGVQSDVEVGHEDIVHGAPPLVPEESVRHPDLAGVRDGEVGDLVWTEGNIKHNTFSSSMLKGSDVQLSMMAKCQHY